MLQTIPQPNGPAAGAALWGGVDWHMPPVWFPGRMSGTVALIAADRQNPRRQENTWYITPTLSRRLAAAVLVGALRDAQTTDKARRYERDQARHWLRSGGEDLEYWLELAGGRITQNDLARWVEGLPHE